MSASNVSLTEAIEKLKGQKNASSVVLMQQGSMTLEYFAPQKIDTQTPHRQDELYVIVRGHGDFNRNGKTMQCKAGDVFFVPAGTVHSFQDFSDDFATWVIFYGKEGGESG